MGRWYYNLFSCSHIARFGGCFTIITLPHWKAMYMSFPSHASVFIGWISQNGITGSKSKCIWNCSCYEISLHKDCIILYFFHHSVRLPISPEPYVILKLKSPKVVSYNFLIYSLALEEEYHIILIWTSTIEGTV